MTREFHANEQERPEVLDRQAIRERAKAATKGPWEQHPVSQRIVLRPGSAIEGRSPFEIGELERIADAEFIAHARTDIPALLAELERAEQVLRGLQRLAFEAFDTPSDHPEIRAAADYFLGRDRG